MKALTLKIENVLNSLPPNSNTSYIEKVKKYSNECGCSLGAKFLVIALVFFIIYIIKFVDFNFSHLLKEVLYGVLFIFIFSITGKLIGIGIARIRLLNLYKSLLKKSHNLKNSAYVNMHQMG